MEQLYKEMQERLKYLEAQEQTEEIKWRIAEMTLSIVRVQQWLLANISSVCDIHKGTRCEKSFPSYTDGKCRECGGQAN